MAEFSVFITIVFCMIYSLRRYCRCRPLGRSAITIGDYNFYEASDVDELNKRSNELYRLFKKVLRESHITIPPEHAKRTREEFDQLFVFHFAINHYSPSLVLGALWWLTPAQRDAVVTSFGMAVRRYVKN